MQTVGQDNHRIQAEARPLVRMGNRGIELNTLEDTWRFATAVSKSGLAPKGLETSEAILVAIQMGFEVGLTPMAALQNVAVINGRPTLWGDATLAVCRNSSLWDESEFVESFNGKPYEDSFEAVCTVKRHGSKAPIKRAFSVSDAKTANLWQKRGKEGQPTPWVTYPKRMLQLKARSFALRDAFGDVLRGMRTTEEATFEEDLKPVQGTVLPSYEVRPDDPPMKDIKLDDLKPGNVEQHKPVQEPIVEKPVQEAKRGRGRPPKSPPAAPAAKAPAAKGDAEISNLPKAKPHVIVDAEEDYDDESALDPQLKEQQEPPEEPPAEQYEDVRYECQIENVIAIGKGISKVTIKGQVDTFYCYTPELTQQCKDKIGHDVVIVYTLDPANNKYKVVSLENNNG